MMKLIKVRFHLILIGGCVSGGISLLLGITAPYIYRSDAIIQLPLIKSVYSGQEDSSDVVRAANLFRSPKVLEEVAREMMSETRENTKLLIPHSVSLLDFAYRISMLSKNAFGFRGKVEPNLNMLDQSYSVLAGLMSRHVYTEPDSTLRTIRISYEAGTPELAKRTVELVVKNFIDLLALMERQDLEYQESYLQKAIARQMDQIRTQEMKMRFIVEKYPELGLHRNDQAGSAGFAQKYLEKKELVAKLDSELESNNQFLSSIKADLTGRRDIASRVNNEVSAKIAEELSELEFKKLQYTQVSGYPDDHPEIVRMQRRIDTLRGVLSEGKSPTAAANGEVPQNATTSRNLSKLYKQSSALADKNRELIVNRKAALGELKTQESIFKEMVRVNFDFESLVRELNGLLAIASDLQKDLQKVRLNMAGSTGRATILSAPYLNVHSTNLSVKKRTIFGFLVGFVIAISLIILVDLLNPLALTQQDFKLISLEEVGTFHNNDRSALQIASWFHTLKQRNVSSTAEKHGVCVVIDVSEAESGWSQVLNRSLRNIVVQGEKVAIIRVIDPSLKGDLEKVTVPGVDLEEMSVDELPRLYENAIRWKVEHHDWVFVVMQNFKTDLPIERIMAIHSDYLVYFSCLGKTSLSNLYHRSYGIKQLHGAEQLTLVFEPTATKTAA